ncbi:tyrosine phosphatase family protein [Thalassospira alkalitolerans]|uniref:Protein tyrosine phosphatase n=1 Tax=Thalassospira alkalitolerans TaxID=1293890 RepID=A0A1Y2LE10_9PROT|nr:protein-tyrosine-phosphatase [Thalassospira alkalitolerans]OSQ48819.1 protein tyrosine phosphatase [Thalassospira alkalitolerans]
MKPVSISLLTICGIEELPNHQTRSVSHVLSVVDPERADLDAFNAYAPHERTILRFHDIIDDLPDQIAPTPAHVEEVLTFGDGLRNTVDTRQDGHLLVHCHMGVSRSTAAMLTLMAQAQPDIAEDELFAKLRAIRPIAWPNSRMIGFADDLLGRGGKLNAALARHYRYQLDHDDHFDEWMTSLGRAREVALGKSV